MFRWLTLSIILHALALLVFTEFLPLTATSLSHGQLTVIEALLLRKPENLTTKPLGSVGEVKTNSSSTKIAQPTPSVANTKSERSSPAESESIVALATPAEIPRTVGGAAPAEESYAKPLESISPDGLREYRLNLSREARRHKRYPALARQRGLEGIVIVMVSAGAGLPVPQVSLSRSSGQEVLDQQALEMLGLAVRSASLPDSLRGRDFAIDLPLHFSLDE